MKKLLRILFRLDNFFATAWVFLFLWLISLIAINLEIFDPFSKAFEDFQYTDLYFNRFKQNEQHFSDDVILVNIGRDRYTIAQQIKGLEEFEPAVIALPTLFYADKGGPGDSALVAVLSEYENIVVAEHLVYDQDEDIVEEEIHCHPKFGSLHCGFDNLIGEQNGTVRAWNPYIDVGGEEHPSFSVKALEFFAPEKVEKLRKRKNNSEIINYMGFGNEAFLEFDEDAAIFPGQEMEVIRGKIVVLGYLGSPMNSPTDLEDKHFTPMNPEMAGRSIPDMYGAEIHANIMATVLEEAYIDVVEEWKIYVLAFLICYLHMALFISISLKVEIWFEPLSKLIALISSIVIFYVIFLLFSTYGIKVDSGLIVLVVLLSGDLLDFYESIALTMNKWFGFKSILAENEL
jgi:CHASE2 domain-containing sensor protein